MCCALRAERQSAKRRIAVHGNEPPAAGYPTGPPCRQTATGNRITRQRNPKTPARRDSNSENLPPGRKIAARWLGNSENPPPRGGVATENRRTSHLGAAVEAREIRRHPSEVGGRAARRHLGACATWQRVWL